MSWKAVKLEKLCKMNSGGTPSRSIKEYYSGEIPWAKISDIEAAEGGFVYSTEEHITKEGLNAINNRIFEKGTLLLAMYGSVGKVAFTGVDMSTNQAILGIRIIDETVLDYSYLKYWFQTIKSKLLDRAVGGTLQNISLGIVKDLEIPLPPLATQKRIAEILDAADALRRKDQELLKKYDELAQAIFIDMFGDPVKNEKGWEKVKMEKLMTIVRGGSPRPIDKFLGGKYPWIKIGDATRGDDVYLNSTREYIIEEGLTKTRLLPAGSLIFANCGVSLGFARIITFEGCIHDGWLAFSDFDDSKINKIFLLKALNSITQYFRDSAPEGTQPNLNTGIIKDFELILPPLRLQSKFELILNSFKGIKENADCNFKNSNNLFNSMIQKAFRDDLIDFKL